MFIAGLERLKREVKGVEKQVPLIAKNIAVHYARKQIE